ncbi:hypothetical protein Nepgr_030455 [Nepenthes gracilis]|uniref:Pectinesterase n=1 Tax=Nepenthes gracilis TaxID=150966 RepID=A0AAD3TFU0_NEPGR|nr:hypothetical protein Nepgr_030455 [Nepenthes gracilis]
MAFEDCKELLQFAIDELQAALTSIRDAQTYTMDDRIDDLKNWLSATISYEQSCLDGITQPNLKDQMNGGMLNATQLTSNALAMISEVSQILQSLNIETNVNTSLGSISRQLLGVSEMGQDGFPGWLAIADRRLLAVQSVANVRPNVVVAKDGSGQFRTINDALRAYPKGFKGRYVIYVKAGIYDEQVTVEKDVENVFMYGDGPRKTLVRGRKSFRDGITTYKTATFSAIGDGFICRSMGFQNVAGPEGHQAVALRVQSDRSAFFNCRIDGYQDSLYAQANRQFYRNCVISGTVDFIFGDGTALIQNSLIIVRKPMDNQQNTVTAQGRTDRRESTGLVIHNCRIVPEVKLQPVRFKIPTFLGRPWKLYSMTVIMESTLADFIQPAGWMPWAGTFALDTLFYREYANRGPGANTARRVKWKGYGVITNRSEALKFSAGPFLQGRLWLPAIKIPYILGLRH